MRTWPAIDVQFDTVGAGISRPDVFQAALTDFDVAAIDERSDEDWRVFFHDVVERDRALDGLRRNFPDLALAPTEVLDENWAARSQANLKAIRVGNIIVAPPWDVPVRLKPDSEDVRLKPDTTATDEVRLKADATDTNVVSGLSRTIIIQPSMGFGTGHHATTRLCLAALQQIDLRGKTVLDVGTGSGVLAITASLLGAAQSVGIDDDQDAIENARENVALNGGVDVQLLVGDLRVTLLAPHDVVLANLTGGLLVQAAERLRELTAPQGRLILSGFMQTEEADVLAAFAALRLADRRQEDEWICVTLQREGAFA
jgi:ribosomal protein L11 methylase PrmA